MIKRFFTVSIFVLFGTFSVFIFQAKGLDISAQSAIAVNCDTGEIVYSKNSREQRSMASTTKIMTSIIAIESGKLDDTVSIKKDINIEGTSAGIKKGYKYKLIDLIYAMMLESGNDAAYVVAEYLCGNEKKFAEKMNKKAKEIGMMNTCFVTASGLDDKNHFTTAYDMALLGSYAIKNDVFRHICSSEYKSISLVEPELTFNYKNHNKLLRTCEGVIGIKTGFTKKSGRCLVSACTRNSVTYVVVTLNAPDDWNDHKKLYDSIYSKTKTADINVTIPESVRVFGGTTESVMLGYETTILGYVSAMNYNIKIYLPQFIYAPVKQGDTVGKVQLEFENGSVYDVNIKAKQSVNSININNKPNFNYFDNIKKFFINLI